MQVYCDIPRYTNDMCNTLCQYDTIFDIRWCISNNRSGHKRELRVYMSAEHGKMFIFCLVFSRFELNIYPINCTNCISIEDETQRRLLSLSTNLSSYFSYQVHRLLRRKSAIRLCVYSSQVSWQYEVHTHTYKHTHTYGISWLLRWEDGRARRRQGSCDEADASTPMNEIKINLLKFLMRILWLCLHFLFLLYCIFFWCSLFSLFFTYALNMNTCKWDAIKILLLLPTKKSMEKWFLICVVCVKIIACCCCCC